MRKKISLLLAGVCVVTGSLLLLPGCLKDRVTESYKIYTPVYELKSTALANINGDPGTAISQTGQIYIKGAYIFLNEVDKGIHVIDNSNPSNPVQTAFLSIPGNLNIGIRNNILYADMYSDLLSIDISNIHQVKVLGSLQGFFQGRNFAPGNEIIASWIVKDTSFSVIPNQFTLLPQNGNVGYLTYPGAANALGDYAASSSTAQSSTGMAGSEAAMTLIGDYLYAIPEEHSLGVVQVTDSTQPTLISAAMAGFDLETIFPIQNQLLLGSKEGVFVYSISNPSQPAELGEFKHGTACDPVIANTNYAYVTLRAGDGCGGSANELDVLSAQDIVNATFVQSYPMTSPTGLCLDGSLLFVCDATVVKVFDASNPDNLQLLSSVTVNNPNDVIAANHLLLVVAAGGLYQFDYTDASHVKEISYLPVNNSKS
jgi:hypothetical protein